MTMRCLKRIAVFSTLVGVSSPYVFGQSCYPTYRLQTETVWENQEVTTYKTEYEESFVENEIVSYKPVVQERVEKRERTVRKPVVETSTVNETYTVMKPVYKTEYVDQSYYQTEYVQETAQREEAYTSFRPQIETQYQTQHFLVQKPVTETQYQTQNYLTYMPVNTTQTAVVDQGSYVAQQYVQPGDTRYHLRWMPGGYNTNATTGTSGYRHGGLGWVPYSAPSQSYNQVFYQPNYQQIAIPQTTYMPQVVQQQVPTQVTRMESQMVAQQVPVQVQKLVPVEERRMVPYSVQKPVTRLVENKVPVQKVDWVQEQHVRPITVQRESYKLETVSEDVPIRTYTTERVVQKVKQPVRIARRVPVKEIRQVPRQVTMRIPLTYYDPFGSSIVSGYSDFVPMASSAAPVTQDSTNGNRVEAKKVERSAPSKDSNQSKDGETMPSPGDMLELGDSSNAKPAESSSGIILQPSSKPD